MHYRGVAAPAAALGALLVLHSTAAHAGKTETVGEILRIALPAGAAGISLAKRDGDGVLQLALSEAVTFGASYALQRVIDEERPDGSDQHSFPSDSAAVAFSAAAYLERRYGWDYGMPAYGVAAFVAYSRVEADKHHWHDVLAGAVLGWAASRLIVSPRMPAQISLASGYGDTPLGMHMHMRW